MRFLWALLVAVIAGILAFLLGAVLQITEIPIATNLGGFLKNYSTAIGILVGCIYLIRNGWER